MPEDVCYLAHFLIEAKRRTYAGLDDDATIAAPLLAGSKQLEHRAEPYVYRDIYFGMGFFVGQETVAKNDRMIWSMCYSGGTRVDLTDGVSIPAIYRFLRQALLAGDVDMPYRGPRSLSVGDFSYHNAVEGTLARFHGAEEVRRRSVRVYELRYNGGLLR